MKKTILLLAAIGMITTGSIAQSRQLNRTNSRTHNSDNSTSPVVPAVPADNRVTERRMNDVGTNGVDGSINDRNNSGANRSSSFDNGTSVTTPPGNNDPQPSNTKRK